MKILLLLISFPDISKHSGIYSDLFEEFIAQGHEVKVVAPSLNGKTTCITKECGHDIIRVKTFPLFSKNIFIKGIANLCLSFQYRKAIKRFLKNEKFDLVLMPTPPINLVAVAKWAKKYYDAKFYLMLKDIFPQNAVDLGIINKKGIFYHYFRRKEIDLYTATDFIGCMSQGNVDYVRKHNSFLNKSKVHILRNSQKSNPIPEKDVELEEKYGLKGKFTIVFGGNMGLPQQVENIVDFARCCQEKYDDVQFLLIGKGTQMTRIKKLVDDAGVKNIIFKDFLPRSEYLKVVSQCQLGLISLNKKFTIPNIPSKTMAYFNVKLPVMAFIDSNTDFGEILQKNELGYYANAGDMNEMLNIFDKLYSSPELRKKMGENGKKYLEKLLSPAVAVHTIVGKVKEL